MLTPRAEPAAASARDDRHDPSAALTAGITHARAGRVTQALTHLERARSGAVALPPVQTTGLLATLVECRLARGDLAAARALGGDLALHVEEPGRAGALAHYGLGMLADAGGEPELAAGHFERTGRLATGPDEDPEGLPWRTAAALTEVRLGRRREAVRLAREHTEIARAAEAAYAVALGLRTLATVDAGRDPVALLREARAALAGMSAARLSAQIDTDLAGMLLLSGGAGAIEALTLLRAAERYAGREQLWPLQGRVRRLLDVLGETHQPAAPAAPKVLTTAEARVARLAAGGLTNREVAARLGVTVKAVEWHLSRVYRKLGIRSREGLAGSLGAAV